MSSKPTRSTTLRKYEAGYKSYKSMASGKKVARRKKHESPEYSDSSQASSDSDSDSDSRRSPPPPAAAVRKQRKKKDPNAPKKAPTAYNLFVKEQMKHLTEISPKERMKEIGRLWRIEKDRA
jgi:hypothetical protein